MHTNSLPPTDVKTFACDALVRGQLLDLRASGWSNTKLGNKLRVSSSVISQYLSEDGNKYPGDVASLERRASGMLRDEALRESSGVETVECDFSAEIISHFEYIRKTNDLGAIFSESGEGKSRAKQVCQKHCPHAIAFNVRSWHRNESCVCQFFFDAAPKGGWKNNTNRMDYAVAKMRGTDLPFIFDDAHKLPIRSLRLIADFYDETNCPIMLIGTLELLEMLQKDAQLHSRVGLGPIVGDKNPNVVIKQIIHSLAPDCNGEFDEVFSLCQQVVTKGGHLRSVYKQLKLAVQMKRDSTSRKPLVAFFHAAHTKLIRNYELQ